MIQDPEASCSLRCSVSVNVLFQYKNDNAEVEINSLVRCSSFHTSSTSGKRINSQKKKKGVRWCSGLKITSP